MKVRALSGYGVKGPACFLVETAGRRFLLDCGEGPDDDARPDLTGVGRIDAVLFGHGHPDHVGALDLLPLVGDPPVHATAPVRALARSPRLAAARDLPFGGTVDILGVAVETGPAGHAPGAVWLRVGGADGLVYTGDFCREGLLYPFVMPPPARLRVFDASYGLDDEPLEDGIAAVVARVRAGPVVLPAPAAGRGLELALALAERGIPVALCAAHRRTAAILVEAGAAALGPDATRRLARLIAVARLAEAGLPPGGAIVAAAANATGGLVARLVTEFEAAAAPAFLFTGHLGGGTPARRLVDAGRAEFRRWPVHPRLSDMAALLAAVRPDAAMPAFLPADRIAGLAAALAGHAVVASGELRSADGGCHPPVTAGP